MQSLALAQVTRLTEDHAHARLFATLLHAAADVKQFVSGSLTTATRAALAALSTATHTDTLLHIQHTIDTHTYTQKDTKI
jgi:hypothetical protein